MRYLFPGYYKFRNYLYSFVLLAGMMALLSLIGWFLAGPAGVSWFLFAGVLIFISAPRFSPLFILHLHRAQALRPEDAPQLYEIITRLTKKAGLKRRPTLHYIPGMAINAFTTGLRKNAAIAVSDGMLRQFNSRELTGVLAHEISHIRNNDLLIMLVANIINHLTGIMSFTGYILIVVYIPLFMVTGAEVPWVLLFVLMISPTLSVLMQLSLSRVHEFNADMQAAELTNDPLGLASALEKIQIYQGNWIKKFFIPSRRMYEPELLRTHPLMADRIKRLKELASYMHGS